VRRGIGHESGCAVPLGVDDEDLGWLGAEGATRRHEEGSRQTPSITIAYAPIRATSAGVGVLWKIPTNATAACARANPHAHLREWSSKDWADDALGPEFCRCQEEVLTRPRGLAAVTWTAAFFSVPRTSSGPPECAAVPVSRSRLRRRR